MIQRRCRRDESETEIHPKWSRTIYINIIMVVYLSIAKASITQTYTHLFSTQNKCLELKQSALFAPKKNCCHYIFLSIMKIKIVETTEKNEIKIKTRIESESEWVSESERDYTMLYEKCRKWAMREKKCLL